MSQPDKKTALYCRLSQDDPNYGDSNSIVQQKKILLDYAEQNGFTNCEFYVDDGYSGIEFENRPDFQRMYAEVKNGNVSTIITKDLSRLGRNHLSVDQYIQLIFPSFNVRYIAINDNIDTQNGDNEFTELRSLFNEWYVRDTSKKIKAVKLAQAKRGERVNGALPYGYKADENDKNHLIIDDKYADIIRELFQLYAHGIGIMDIVRTFKEKHYINPTALRMLRKEENFDISTLDEPYVWNRRSMGEILSNPVYLGHTYTHQSGKVSYKTKKIIEYPVEEQFEFLNTHEAIIDTDTWAIVQKRKADRPKVNRQNEVDCFAGMLYCGDCGTRMSVHREMSRPRIFFTCEGYNSRREKANQCTPHSINKKIVEAIVLDDLKRITAIAKSHRSDFIELCKTNTITSTAKEMATKKHKLTKSEKRLGEVKKLFIKLYEDNASGKITDEDYKFLSNNYKAEQKDLEQLINNLNSEITESTNNEQNIDCFLKIIDKYTDITELSYDLLRDFIDKILIYEKDKEINTRKIEIFYNFVGNIS